MWCEGVKVESILIYNGEINFYYLIIQIKKNVSGGPLISKLRLVVW